MGMAELTEDETTIRHQFMKLVDLKDDLNKNLNIFFIHLLYRCSCLCISFYYCDNNFITFNVFVIFDACTILC